VTLLSKIVKKESEAIYFGAFSFCADLGTIVINLVGGQLYDNVNKLWPFYMGLISYGILFLLILIFSILGQLKV